MSATMISAPKIMKGISLERVIGDLRGDTAGPTLVILAGVHGNEAGGVIATKRVLDRFQKYGLIPHGHLICLAGNQEALRLGVRYVDADLNRMWKEPVLKTLDGQANHEYQEYLALNLLFDQLAAESQRPLVVMDLHSFSGKGFPFLIAPTRGMRQELFDAVPFPVITGLNEFVKGTICGHLEQQGHETLILEGGRDSDPEVPINIEAFIWHLMARLQMLDACQIPASAHKTWASLSAQRDALPAMVHTRYRHAIGPEDQFKMDPGFRTFDFIEAGQRLAFDVRGPVYAPFSGWLLMPLYQAKGEDGFFLASSEP